MSTALYRRYRPETFADVIGQAHVTEPLMQALRSGRVHHAYLFSGPRGCGKTTSARIMARCLNCELGPTPEPCGTCESCVALARSGPGTVDVIEIDAASHGGVEDARDLRERAAFGPAQSRYKVYIIDEAHMVTTHGFNALLKVVEEPPEHVKFVFATTEPEKVLSTIRSRTHHYPFHLVPPQRLATYLEQVCRAEGTSLEPGVLSFVTRAGGGSVRDSLSVLDQLIAGAGEEGLTYERTAALLGFTDTELLDAVVDAVAAADAASVFTQVNKVMESGQDPRRFVEDLLERYRDLIVVAAVGERTGGLLRGLPEDQVARLRQQSSVSGHATLTRAADVVSRGLSEMTGAVSYRMHLELICARLLLPGAAGEQGYAARLDRIERRLAAGGSGAQPSSQPSQEDARPGPAPSGERPAPRAAEPVQQAASGPPSAPADSPRSGGPADSVPASPPAVGALDTDAVRRAWPEVLDKVK
ncbi:MAG: DNA polymerase III subunit gamma and tau, partial [Actinomycetota bacterium]|nr:DNA polymerase III subunit gamma and tau [Actinomycetota bacterium]